jgi:2-polyprenyl-6-methoxyphenol hydroxylase-like FAD-dependent oxidoreductase
VLAARHHRALAGVLRSPVTARPAGTCVWYPMSDAWTDRPDAPGAVLVGGAAGWTDPITGQGLSNALRDARLVAEAVRPTGGSFWGQCEAVLRVLV